MADNSKVFLDLRQKVLDQIVAHPETHDQADWETSSPSCGTRRCVAGWAIHFAAPRLPSADVARAVIARDLGVDPRYFIVGKELLGLTDAEAYELFYGTTDDEAVDLLGQYAQGYATREVEHTEGYDPNYIDEGE
jgi:hypothetical protein